jgi:hypothetical protein
MCLFHIPKNREKLKGYRFKSIFENKIAERAKSFPKDRMYLGLEKALL